MARKKRGTPQEVEPAVMTRRATLSVSIPVEIAVIAEAADDGSRAREGSVVLDTGFGLDLTRKAIWRAAREGDQAGLEAALAQHLAFYLHDLAGFRTVPPTIRSDGRCADLALSRWLTVHRSAEDDER